MSGIQKFAAALAVSLASTAASAGEVWLTMDYVKPYKLDRAAGQIVVGNPAIADIRVLDSQTVLLYAKGPGSTNFYIFDEDGQKLDDLIVRVQAIGNNKLTFQRGGERATFDCITYCDPTITVGDGQTFGEIAQQVIQKNQQELQINNQ